MSALSQGIEGTRLLNLKSVLTLIIVDVEQLTFDALKFSGRVIMATPPFR